MKLSFTIPGPPRTKKTSNRIVRCGKFPKVLPSKAFEEWNRMAQIRLRARGALAVLGSGGCEISKELCLPLEVPVNCRALFYRERMTGDAVGYYQALADALEEAGIVENDRLVVSWDGSRMLKDAANPRVEVVLEVVD